MASESVRIHLHDSGVQHVLTPPDHEALRVTVVGDDDCLVACGVEFEGSNDNLNWVSFKQISEGAVNQEFASPYIYLRLKGFGAGESSVNAAVVVEYLDELAASSSSVVEATGARDAFGRWRVSNPKALFDSKLLYGKAPLFWAETLAGAATSVHSTAKAAVTMSVAGAGDSAIRQTKQRFNYQPGRSQLCLFTTMLGEEVAGVTKRLGLFDANNGLFFQQDEDGLHFVVRNGGSDTVHDQADWNGDKIDGFGESELNYDPTKTTIFWLDFEWLGVGAVRYGVVHSGAYVVCGVLTHEQADLSAVYMASPNLPVRYSIDSTSGAGSLDQICSAVISEGGQDDNVILRSVSTEGTHVDANSTAAVYAVVGIRLKSTHLGATVFPTDVSLLSKTNDNFEWFLMLNPTVAGTFTYLDEDESAVQAARGATANTVTNGYRLPGGWAASSAPAATPQASRVALGADIAGTPDEIVLCVRPLSSNADIEGTINFAEVL